MSEIVAVAAAVIVRGDGQVLLGQRPPGKHYAGYWEFPGGKVEAGETPRAALARELREELGLRVTRACPWLTQRYTYPHARVELNFFRVLQWEGEPHGHEGQAFAWQRPGAWTVAPLLPANTRILRALELPPACGITMAQDMGLSPFLARAERAMQAGLRLLQLREPGWNATQRRALAAPLRALARRYEARILLNGDSDEAGALGLDGVHWNSARLLAAGERPAHLMCSASCHNLEELARAAALDLDFVVLGPVAATPTHPGSLPLGWDRFAQLIAGYELPVYALGGMVAADLDRAWECGAHGLAMRRAAWSQEPVKVGS
jgi:8-oxo-dGTP diphosphatase